MLEHKVPRSRGVVLTVLSALCLLSCAAAFIPTAHFGGNRLSVRGRSSTLQGLRAAKATISEPRPELIATPQTDGINAALNQILKARFTPKLDGKKTVIVTGASSGIGLEATRQLVLERDCHVIMACRSYSKAIRAAKDAGFNPEDYTILTVDLASLDNVRAFVKAVRATGRSVDALVCNAAVWYPQDTAPRLTADGYEEAVGTNHLAHFLMCNLFLQDMKAGSKILFIGTETANDGLAGKVPPVADLGKLEGMMSGMKNTIDGKEFEPTKAYKESKVCNAIVMRELNKRYKDRGIVVNAMFPGCIAESPLFRQKRGWFRWLFPLFQKYVTKQYVSEREAGRRIASCITDDSLAVGGAYWKWNAKSGIDAEFKLTDENSIPAANTVRIPAEALDELVSETVWDLSCALTGVNVAPEIRMKYDGKPEAEAELGLYVGGGYVRDDPVKADILLRRMRALGDDIKKEDVVTRELVGQWAKEMENPELSVVDKLYFWGRRRSVPKIELTGVAGDDESKLSIKITEEMPRWDERAAQLLTKMLNDTLPKTAPCPGIDMFDERDCPRISTEYKGNKTGDIDDDLCVKLTPHWCDTGESMRMLKESVINELGPEVWGDYTRDDDIIPRELVAKVAAQAEILNEPPPDTPPTGLDAAIFGERGTLQRLLFSTITQGAIKD